MRPFLFCLLLTTLVRGAMPTVPGPVLTTEAEAAWQPLFQALARPRPIQSTFEEERCFTFHKRPVHLRGEMRLDPAHGLSLRYLEPEPKLVVMDGSGVLLRDAKGRTRAVPADARAGSIERALLPALRFDLPEIRAGFILHAARDGNDWRLDLEPRDASIAQMLGSLIIEGSGQEVRRLEFRRSSSQRVVINLLTTIENVPFTAEELRRYFR